MPPRFIKISGDIWQKSVMTIYNYCQILARQAKIPQIKDEQRYQPIFFSSFQGHVHRSLKYTGTQRLNCRCQELDSAHFTVSFVPTWRIFTPPVKFLPHLDNFTPILKMSETR